MRKSHSLTNILEDVETYKVFKAFLQLNHCEENLEFLEQIEKFKSENRSEQKLEIAANIIDTFLLPISEKELNISSELSKPIIQKVQKNIVNDNLFDNIEDVIRLNLAEDSITRFLQSDIFYKFSKIYEPQGTENCGDFIKKWKEEQVGRWLSKIGMSQYSKLFQNHCISGADLLDLNDKDLQYMGITKFADRKNLLNSIKNLKQNSKYIKIKVEDSSSKEKYFIVLRKVSTLKEMKKNLREYTSESNFHLKALDIYGNCVLLSNDREVQDFFKNSKHFKKILIDTK